MKVEASQTTHTKFTLTDRERSALEAFLEQHENCVDSELTFELEQTGIGVATTVSCQCGKSRNITDYSTW